MPLESKNLTVGRFYRAKKPAPSGFPPLTNDRQIKYIGGDKVQYDGPAVANGRHYPMTTIAAFLKWADRDVTDELPPGEWADYPPAKACPSCGSTTHPVGCCAKDGNGG